MGFPSTRSPGTRGFTYGMWGRFHSWLEVRKQNDVFFFYVVNETSGLFSTVGKAKGK